MNNLSCTTLGLLALFSVMIAPVAHADDEWPKACHFAPNPTFTVQEKNFCLDFVADYFYRLHFTAETHVYSSGSRSQQYQRPELSTEGALFLAAMSQSESGTGNDTARDANNYWGLGGAYRRADGTSTFMRFSSFDSGLAYFFNHLDRGITSSAEDTAYHPGWPGFVEQLTRSPLVPAEINKALHSGPSCAKFPAYNTDAAPGCADGAKPGAPNCPCINYAGIVQDVMVARTVSKCLGVYQKFGDLTVTSKVYGASEAPALLERRKVVADELQSYARSRCGLPVPNKQASARRQRELSEQSAMLSAVSAASAGEKQLAISVGAASLKGCEKNGGF